jgi:L-threonylcarbamoyladenylate synthase
VSAFIGQDLTAAKELLEKGELVAIPTETVYGLAANALNAEAVLKIFEVKNRPHFDPLIVHLAAMVDMYKWALDVPEIARILAEKFWPGPLTILLKKNEMIPDLVTSGLDTVGLRMPNHLLTLNLLRSLEFPLAAPSANPFGYISPTSAAHVHEQLGDQLRYILDGGLSEVGVESTIVDCSAHELRVLRLGGISLEELEEVVGTSLEVQTSSSKPNAPGMLLSHYAPRKPMVLGDIPILLTQFSSQKIGILSFKEIYPKYNNQVLSVNGDLREAAHHLFGALRKLDNENVDVILCELLPEEGLGRAVNDRLRRAAYMNEE